LDHERIDVYQIDLKFVSMLSKLVGRFSPVTQVREDRLRYEIEDEDDGRWVMRRAGPVHQDGRWRLFSDYGCAPCLAKLDSCVKFSTDLAP